MNRTLGTSLARVAASVMILGVFASVAALMLFGSRAIREWEKSSTLLKQRRAGEAASVLLGVLTRDMRGVQATVLQRMAPADVGTVVAGAFARYPYPESFFEWHALESSGLALFNRTDRTPPWMAARGSSAKGQDADFRFPVTPTTHREIGGKLLERIRQDAAYSRGYSVFETTLGGERYQVVARLFYDDVFRERLESVFGFTVNLGWVRANYFPELAREAAAVENMEDVGLVILDERNEMTTGAGRGVRLNEVRREFPLLFFDPSLIVLDPPGDLPQRRWAVEAENLGSSQLDAAIRVASRTLLAAGFSAVVLALGLTLTVRASRARIRLSEMRSEFVATVTHELKTPLATIRAIGETLIGGRIDGAEVLHDYGDLLVQEAKRQTHLVNNLLAYARITDVTDAYSFEPLQVTALVGDVLQRFRSQLAAGPFEVTVDIPADLPAVRADRTAMELLLDNLVDNAIRYSGDQRVIRISASRRADRIVVEVADRGIGIPKEEIEHVIRRFFRGRRTRSSGSGLGLAIAHRIAADHGGALMIASELESGTTVAVSLPVAA
jgi:signal transduction histidine kinase